MQDLKIAPIEKIEKESYAGDVWNLETEDKEYVVSYVVVHNCPHYWNTQPDRIPVTTCRFLWMGA